MDAVTDRVGALDTARVAGLLVVGSVVLLGLLRKGFSGVSIRVGD